MESKSINFFTPKDFGDLFLTLYPTGKIDIECQNKICFYFESTSPAYFLRLTSETIFGPGVAWIAYQIGPSDWIEEDTEILESFQITSTQGFINVLKHVFGSLEPHIAKEAKAFVA